MTDFFEPVVRGVQHANLRAANRRAVLTTIIFNSGISNADVSRRTGLAPQTASAIVADLEAEGLVVRGEVLRGRRGQPATPLLLNIEAHYSIGCEISWDHIEIVLINLGSQEIARYRRDYTYPDAGKIVAEATGAIETLLARLDSSQRKRATDIGLAIPSNFYRGLEFAGLPPDQVKAWRDLDLRAAIETATGLPVRCFDDGDAGCWSEMIMRVPPRPRQFVYLHLGSYLGSGVIAEHMLRLGPPQNSCMLGSMYVTNAAGQRQFGHLVASLTPFRQALAAAGITVPLANPRDWPWAEWETLVAPWIASASDALATIIMNTRAALDCDLFVVDGELPPEILARLAQATREAMGELPVLALDRPVLETGRLGTRAVSLGAAQLPLFIRLLVDDVGSLG